MNKLFTEAFIKGIGENDFEVIASTSDKDRMNDIIKQDGWVLTNFKKNPVMLWGHNNQIPPIAKATKIWVEDDKLKIRGVFADTPLAREIKSLVMGGFINAVSVGFIPLKTLDDEKSKGDIEVEGKWFVRADEEEMKELREKGFFKENIFTKQELLEVSWVAVPALAQALVTARKGGLELGAIMSKALEIKETKDFEEAVSRAATNEPTGEKKTVVTVEEFERLDSEIKALREVISKLEGKNPVENADVTPNSKKVEEPAGVKKGERNISAELRLLRAADKALEAVIISIKKANK